MPTGSYPGETAIGTISEFPNPPGMAKMTLSVSQPEPANRLRLDSAMTAPAPVPSLPMLLAKLVELGREAWWISERERMVRAEIEALREIEENEG
ncbi:MAG: hypothetical protein ACRDRP_13710 [Pseudonocardiaceae bacterium]